jgi:hypothetical protein
MRVLGVELVITPDNEWLFCGASPLPDLRTGGDRALAALARTLKDHV